MNSTENLTLERLIRLKGNICDLHKVPKKSDYAGGVVYGNFFEEETAYEGRIEDLKILALYEKRIWRSNIVGVGLHANSDVYKISVYQENKELQQFVYSQRIDKTAHSSHRGKSSNGDIQVKKLYKFIRSKYYQQRIFNFFPSKIVKLICQKSLKIIR